MKFYIVGFFVAFLIGLTGVGGGTLTVPVLIMLGIEPSIAVGISLGFSALIKIPSSIVYFFKGHIEKKTLFYLSAGGIPGVILGSLLLGNIYKHDKLRSLILLMIGLTLVISSLVNLWHTLKDYRPTTNKYAILLPLFAFLIGFEVGTSSSGAGALGTLLLLSLTTLSPSDVVGTDITFGLILSLIGGGIHLFQGLSDTNIIVKMVTGGIFGAIGGAFACIIFPKKPARIFLLLWLIFVGSMLFIRSLR
ncbi:sulfite exporter TauE/SafE family protein [Methylacidiphilum caldifontis]|uniref:Probable membrane transporter protein n=1 Tax=Methylacidiphilum caldifontis TaxID=2795386 RepID=A0A4Y8PG27_9BACT|nr:sulfite exporter TauE/SafE family protein [Methylacidiphilum caldifontis]QSR89385.1 sulfite exporter TauE/SafE family protein [Methylacidiphilum caldifontis]TFE71062.1 permease [Methylacidiphilum caldifontis]